MNHNQTVKLTTGAMFVAIFAVLMIINRYTGGTFQGLIMYILPIPMVAYSAKFGAVSSIPVAIAMALISIFFGTPTAIFYALTESMVGLSLGSCVYHKVDMTKALFLCMILSVISSVLNYVLFASLFGGKSLSELVQSYIELIQQSYEKAGKDTSAIASLLDPATMTRLFIIGVILVGIMDGFLVFELSLLILNRLHFQIARPKSVYLYYPYPWTGWVAFLCFFAYYICANKLADSPYLVYLQTLAICGDLYLAVFGFIGILFAFRVRMPEYRWLGVVIGVIGLYAYQMLLVYAGFVYICTDLHRRFESALTKSE